MSGRSPQHALTPKLLGEAVLSRREDINATLRGQLDEVCERWGVQVTAVEIREITAAREIQEALMRQMSAERSRRAVIIDVDGKRDAAVRVADDQEQAAILEAEGYAQALAQICTVMRHLDSQTMNLQYMEALKALGATPSAKLVVPAEVTRACPQTGVSWGVWADMNSPMHNGTGWLPSSLRRNPE